MLLVHGPHFEQQGPRTLILKLGYTLGQHGGLVTVCAGPHLRDSNSIVQDRAGH